MPLLAWDDDFETGIPAADHEHGKLVDLINTIYGRWWRSRNRDPAKLFDDLFNIFLSHFEFEDHIMAATGYTARDAHERDHARVVDQLRDIAVHVADEPGYDLAAALASCLQHWLIGHIRDHDAPMYKALTASRSMVASTTQH